MMPDEQSIEESQELSKPVTEISPDCKHSLIFQHTRGRLKAETKVRDSDADVSFLSSDGIIFKIHSTNLNAICGGFPPAEIKAAENEKVPLPEDSKTLETLFIFIYPRRHPDLTNISFELLLKIAEAAEKYQVFSAMNICKSRMRECASQHPLDVFCYASKHDYEDVIAATIPHLHELSLQEVVGRLPAQRTAAWVEYHLMWAKKFKSTFTKDSKTYGVKFVPRPSGLKKITIKTHLDEVMMANALLNLTRRCPDALSKEDAREAIRAALTSAGHMDPDGPAAQEASYQPSDAEIFKNSVEVFMKALEKNLSTLPSFHEYLNSRNGAVG